MLGRFYFILILTWLCLVKLNGQLPYIVPYTQIPEELKEIWHDAESGNTYLITVDRLCILKSSDFRCKVLGLGKDLMYHNQTFDHSNRSPIFLGNYGEFYHIENERLKLKSFPTKFPNAAIYEENGNTWVADYQIYKYSEDRIDTIPVIMNSELPYWDIRQQTNGDLWFVNYASGAYKVNPKSNVIKRVSNLNGLPTNFLSCLHINDKDQVFVGYKGGVALIYNDMKIETFNFQTHIGNAVIKEIESDGNGNLWLITDKHLCTLNLETKELNVIPTNKSDDFIIHTLDYNPTQDVMLIGTSHGLFISSFEGNYYHGQSLYSTGSMYYFAGELLISGKRDVYSFSSKKQQFLPSNYRAIRQSFRNTDGNYWVTDKRNVILIDRENAKVIKKLRKPVSKLNQIVELNGVVYMCHDKGIYARKNRRTTSLIRESEPFFNVLACADKTFAVSEEGIYLIEGSEIHHESVLEHSSSMLRTNKQFFIDENSMFIPAKNYLIKVDCKGDSIKFSHYPTLEEIYDFHFQDEKIYILHSNHLLVYDKEAFIHDPYNASCAIPCLADENSKIFVDEEANIWIQNKQGLASIDVGQDKICNILRVDGLSEELESEESTEDLDVQKDTIAPSISNTFLPFWAILLGGVVLLILLILLIFRLMK